MTIYRANGSGARLDNSDGHAPRRLVARLSAVEAIRRQLQAGTYQIDPLAIAQALIVAAQHHDTR